MMRRLTVACGLLTLAVAVALAVQPGHALFGARSGAGVKIAAIPDKPAPSPPPPHPLPPAPQPQPLHRAPVQTQPAPSPGRVVLEQITNTLLNLPRVLTQRARPSDEH